MWLKLASPPSTSIQGTLYTICRVQQRLQQLNMPHQLVPPLASTAKTEPFQPVAPCPSFSKSPRKSHSAFKPETQRPRLFDPGGRSPTRGFVVCATLVHVFYRTSVRSNVCSVDVLRVVRYRAGTFLCMRSCPCPSWPSWSRRGCVRAVAWLWRPWMWPWRGAAVAVASAVFVSPSCGCDTPMNASVRNGFGVVCVGSICTTYVVRV